MPGHAAGCRGDHVENERMAAPRAADDDELRVGQRYHGGEDPADGLAQRVTDGLPLLAADRGEQAVGVDRRGPWSPEAELVENVNELHCLAPRSSGDEVRDLAGQTARSSPDFSVADDRAAHAGVEVKVGEVAQGPRGCAVPFRHGGPVHVVVHGDWSVDVRGENAGRVKLAEQERGIRQLDQSPGAPVYRVSGAYDR